MPKQTFLNLASGRRQSFIEASLKEFGSRDFHSASISSILDRLQIAKGSFYQYFQNKEDLYRYLIEISENRRNEVLELVRDRIGDNFLDWLRSFYLVLTKFYLKFPLYSTFLAQALSEGALASGTNISGEIRKRRYDDYLDIVRRGIRLSGDMNIQSTALLLMAIEHSIGDYLALAYNIDFSDPDNSESSINSVTDQELIDHFSITINLLRNGIEQ